MEGEMEIPEILEGGGGDLVLLADESGQALIEYALVTFFVSIAAVTILTSLGGKIVTMITSVSNAF
jgi:Flp pilus assembly pilin Flp